VKPRVPHAGVPLALPAAGPPSPRPDDVTYGRHSGPLRTQAHAVAEPHWRRPLAALRGGECELAPSAGRGPVPWIARSLPERRTLAPGGVRDPPPALSQAGTDGVPRRRPAVRRANVPTARYGRTPAWSLRVQADSPALIPCRRWRNQTFCPTNAAGARRCSGRAHACGRSVRAAWGTRRHNLTAWALCFATARRPQRGAPDVRKPQLLARLRARRAADRLPAVQPARAGPARRGPQHPGASAAPAVEGTRNLKLTTETRCCWRPLSVRSPAEPPHRERVCAGAQGSAGVQESVQLQGLQGPDRDADRVPDMPPHVLPSAPVRVGARFHANRLRHRC